MVEMADMGEDVEMNPNSGGSTRRKRPARFSRRAGLSLKSLIGVVCVVGLVYQVSTLVVQYVQYKTVVDVEFEIIKYNRMPAFTVCYPRYLAMNKVVEKYPQLKSAFFEYKNALFNVSESDYRNKTFRQYLNRIYENQFEKFVHNQSLTVGELEDLSIDFAFDKNSSYFASNSSLRPINVKVSGLQLFENKTVKYVSYSDTRPIESVLYPYSSFRMKCFTFNSHLNKTNRQYQMDIRIIKIKVRHHEDWFPPTLFREKNLKIWLAMHSSNNIPVDLFPFNDIQANSYFTGATYNRWKTKLLKSPYKTKCVDYDMDGRTEYKLRSDCVIHCIHKEVNRHCSPCSDFGPEDCRPCFLRSEALWRMELIKKYRYDKLKMCGEINHFSSDANLENATKRDLCMVEHYDPVKNHCQLKCQPDCVGRYYNLAVNNRDKFTDEQNVLLSPFNKETWLDVYHSQMPDQITEHTEDMTFIDFFGTFGGLFGIWLGLSALAIFQSLVNHFS